MPAGWRACPDVSNGSSSTKAWSYNVNGQLASLNWSGNIVNGGIQYVYSATQNNGQITQAVDTLSGETISYQYDALKRLTSAASTAAWTQTYQYDGFGNLTAKVLNGSSTPIPVNAATNQLTNASYDANGNMTSGAGATLTYDEANRISAATETSGGAAYYGYSPDNKRIYMNGGGLAEQWTFYGAKGEKLGVFGINNPALQPRCGSQFTFAPEGMSVWFAGKLIQDSSAAGAQPVAQDRLGTNRANGARFRPYGDEITSTANDREKFATYTRDSYTGFDYADQRFYASTYGRFNTPDPYKASGGPSDPGSWNRYSYVEGDPVNAKDPRGLYLINGADESDLWGGGGLGDGCSEMDPSHRLLFQLWCWGFVLLPATEAAATGRWRGQFIGSASNLCELLWNTIPVRRPPIGGPFGRELLGKYSASTVQQEDLYMEQAI